MTSPATANAFFELWWNVYPRRANIVGTREAWFEACQLCDPRTLIEAATRYANDKNRPPQFTLASEKWLREQRWHDSDYPPRDPTPAELARQEGIRVEERRRLDREHSEKVRREFDEARARSLANPRTPETEKLLRDTLAKITNNRYPESTD